MNYLTIVGNDDGTHIVAFTDPARGPQKWEVPANISLDEIMAMLKRVFGDHLGAATVEIEGTKQ